MTPDINQKLCSDGKKGIFQIVAPRITKEFLSVKILFQQLKKNPPKKDTFYQLPMDIGKSHFDVESWGIFDLIDDIFCNIISEKSTFVMWNTLLRDEKIKNAKLFYDIEAFLDLFKIKPESILLVS